MDQSPALPHRPDFDVYGIRDAAADQRWLALWNQAAGTGMGPLAQVSLGYGVRDRARLIVVTDAKLDDHDPTESEPWSYRATGLKDAVISALLCVVNASVARAGETGGAPIGQIGGQMEELSSHIGGPLWTEDRFHAEGRLINCHVHSIDRMWVAAADLGSVAVGVAGLDAELNSLDIAPVNDQLESYM